MKYLIASDVHGSSLYANKIVETAKTENADFIILLGDIYNHGPRNPLPEEYAPLKVAECFNSVKDKLIVIKGNCDSEVDTYISEFDFVENTVLSVNGKTVFLSHGNVYNKENLPKQKYDVIFYGHFHTAFIEKLNGQILVNPGSVSLPKDGFSGYVLLDGSDLTLKSFDGSVLDSIKL